MKKKKEKKKGPYYRKFNNKVQQGLAALSLIGCIPAIERAKPGKPYRKFLLEFHARLRDLQVKPLYGDAILREILYGIDVTSEASGGGGQTGRLRMFIGFCTKLGLEMEPGRAQEILSNVDAMDTYTTHHLKDSFKEFFKGVKLSTPKTHEPEEDIEDEDEDDDEEEAQEATPETAVAEQ